MDRSAASRTRGWLLAVRGLLIAAGALLSANAIWLALTANLTIGAAATAILGIGLVAWGSWLPKVSPAVSLAAVVVLVAVLGLSVFLAVAGSVSNARYDEDAVIVLGAAVHGREMSRTLTGRMDSALAYHQRNPRALIVVSGGQGPQEDLAEAVAMRQYLLDHQVPDSLIVVDDQATSTEENFANSRALLDSRLAPGYRVAFITDEFHVYRASRDAAAAGFNATHLSRSSAWYFWPTNYLREDLMVIRLWLTGS
jgi:uncharacterized SAM-binding protein YcdF (DUF218 family)